MRLRYGIIFCLLVGPTSLFTQVKGLKAKEVGQLQRQFKLLLPKVKTESVALEEAQDIIKKLASKPSMQKDLQRKLDAALKEEPSAKKAKPSTSEKVEDPLAKAARLMGEGEAVAQLTRGVEDETVKQDIYFRSGEKYREAATLYKEVGETEKALEAYSVAESAYRIANKPDMEELMVLAQQQLQIPVVSASVEPDIPTAPSLEGVPVAPSLEGVPTAPEAPGAPIAPDIPTAPSLEGVPVAPSLEGVPTAPEAPAAPGAPTAPTAPGGAATPADEPKKPEPTKKSAVALTEKESDELFVKAWQTIAKNVGLKFTEQKFESDLKGYISVVRKELEGIKGFKKAGELTALIGKKKKPVGREKGTFDIYVEKLKVGDDESLRVKYDEFVGPNDLLAEFMALLAPCVSDPSVLTEIPAVTIIINILVSQRSASREPNALDQATSDGLIEELFGQLLAVEELQTRAKAALEAERVAAEKAAAKKEAAKGKLKQEVQEEEEPEKVLVPLSRNYFDDLYALLNRARLHPDFMRFAFLLGQAARDNAAGKQSDIDKQAWTPLLELLRSDDVAIFTPRRLLMSFKKQLFFDVTEFDQLLESGSVNYQALSVLLQDHRMRLQQRKGKPAAAAPYVTFKRGITNAKTAKDVVSALGKLRMAVGTKVAKDAVKAMETEFSVLERAPKDVALKQLPTVIETLDSFKELDETERQGDLEYLPKRMGELLEAYKKETAPKRSVIMAIKKAKDEFKKGKEKEKVGATLVADLRELDIPEAQKAKLTSPMRTASDVKTVFDQQLGANVAVKYVKKEDLYKWLEPYGELLKVLGELPTDTAGLKKPNETLATLKDSLESLDAGIIRPNRSYTTLFGLEQAMVNAGFYKGYLTAMREAFAAYNLVKAFDEIRNLVTLAKVGAEDTAEFKQALQNLRDFLVPVMLAEVARQVDSLNRGTADVTIPGLPLEGPQRAKNAKIYKALKGNLARLKEALPATTDALKGLDGEQLQTAIDETSSDITTALEAAQLTTPEVLTSIGDFMAKEVKGRLENLQAALKLQLGSAVATGAEITTQETPAPVTDESGVPPVAPVAPPPPPLPGSVGA